jgi:hypothetical protein
VLQAPVDRTTSLRNATKQQRNALFKSPAKPESIPEIIEETIIPLEEVQPSEIENFFLRTRSFLQSEAMELQGEISKNSCEFIMGTLKKIQINQGFQTVVIILLYLLLIGVFKILLRIISILGFFLFVIIKPFKIYKYQKETVQREKII